MSATPSFLRISLISLAACFEQADFRSDRAAHSGISGEDVILVQPGAIDPMMACGGTEIPDPWIAGSGQQAVSDQLVARPLADDGARNVTDVVLIEAQHRAETGLRQRLTRAGQTITVQTLESRHALRNRPESCRAPEAAGASDVPASDRLH